MSEDRLEYDQQPTPIEPRQEHRCGKCGRLIAVGVIKSGTILEIKCRCNAMNVLSAA